MPLFFNLMIHAARGIDINQKPAALGGAVFFVIYKRGIVPRKAILSSQCPLRVLYSRLIFPIELTGAIMVSEPPAARTQWPTKTFR
jgi:hypothetical protein